MTTCSKTCARLFSFLRRQRNEERVRVVFFRICGEKSVARRNKKMGAGWNDGKRECAENDESVCETVLLFGPKGKSHRIFQLWG